MGDSVQNSTSRRAFLANTGRIAGAAALATVAVPHVHAAQDDTIQVALIGCGGRGTGAASNALSVPGASTKLVAMADVFEDRLTGQHKNLTGRFGDRIDVPQDRRFVGFDAYKKAMDCLEPGGVVILGTPPAFRWPHFTYSIEKGLHTFMEKPVTVDGPTTRRMIALAKEAKKKNLKVGVGLMVRHCRGRRQLFDRIKSGEIGEVLSLRAYRMSGVSQNAYCPPNDGSMSEPLFQVRRFHSFLWASGGVYSDYYIHQIDECSWMKDAWPVKAAALGGRHYREGVDQNLDTYSVEYTYPDGTKLYYYGRNMSGCHNEFASYAHGTKGCGIISKSSHHPGRVRTFKGQHFAESDLIWAVPRDQEPNPYQMEWNDLIDAIQNDKPYNEAERGALASLVTSMGRMAAHTGQIIEFDQIFKSDHEFAPDIDKLTIDGPAPLKKDKDGLYPVPMPGIITKREYGDV